MGIWLTGKLGCAWVDAWLVHGWCLVHGCGDVVEAFKTSFRDLAGLLIWYFEFKLSSFRNCCYFEFSKKNSSLASIERKLHITFLNIRINEPSQTTISSLKQICKVSVCGWLVNAKPAFRECNTKSKIDSRYFKILLIKEKIAFLRRLRVCCYYKSPLRQNMYCRNTIIYLKKEMFLLY